MLSGMLTTVKMLLYCATLTPATTTLLPTVRPAGFAVFIVTVTVVPLSLVDRIGASIEG